MNSPCHMNARPSVCSRLVLSEPRRRRAPVHSRKFEYGGGGALFDAGQCSQSEEKALGAPLKIARQGGI